MDKYTDAPEVGTDAVLRAQAEAIVLNTKALSREFDTQALSPEATRQTLHELQVHQIELEMQNEELRRTQGELEAAHARYFDLYNLAPVGYCTVSNEGLILRSNLTAATLLGLAGGAMVKQPVSRFIVNVDQDIYYLSRRKLIDTGERQTCVVRMVKKDNSQIWISLAITAAEDGDAPVLRMALIDITERVHLYEVLQEKNVELERAKSVAEKANQAKSDFLSSMSHELRSPLNAILGFAQLLESSTAPQMAIQKESAGHILKAGWYLLDLINEILDLASVESGKLFLAQEPMSLTDVMLECQSMIEPQAEKRNIHVVFPKLDTRYFVKADRTRVKQILLNLLSNAIKYNRVDGTVVVECILVSPERIRVNVSDTGMGLSAEKQAQLFQPFNRLGQESGSEEGTGIGLVLTKRLIELMGGIIGVESKVGMGSVFWVELIRDADPHHAMGASITLGGFKPAHGCDVGPCTVLYVEDSTVNMKLVEQLIAFRPTMRLLCAGDVTRAIELARAHQPEVILMDINLPGISGIEALQILREDPLTRHILVIAISANAMPEDIERGMAAGFFRYLTKPIKINEFMETLDAALNTAKAQLPLVQMQLVSQPKIQI